MTSMQWSIKYRPTKIEQMVVGNPDALERATDLSENAQAILVTGDSGTGKTTLARILARQLNGETFEHSLLEVNFASQESRGISGVTEISSRIEYKPTNKKWVVIIDEVHGGTPQALKSLLKLLEDPPHDQVLFILCTDKPWKLEQPMINRCRPIAVKRPDYKELARYLLRIAKRAKVEAPLDDLKKVALRCAKESDCVPRMALQFFEDACVYLRKGKPIEDVVRIVSEEADNDLNKVVGTCILAIFEGGKSNPEKAAKYLLTATLSNDAFGLLNRLQGSVYYGAVMFYTGKFQWQGKIFKQALDSRNLKPTMEDVLLVANRLNDIREQLKEVVTDPVVLVGSALAQLPMLLHERK